MGQTPHFFQETTVLMSMKPIYLLILGGVLVSSISSFEASASERVEYNGLSHRCERENGNGDRAFRISGGIGPCRDLTNISQNFLFHWRLYFSKDLKGIGLFGGKRKKVRLKNKNLEGSLFSETEVEEINLRKSQLSYIEIIQSKLINADISKASGRDLKILASNLHGANFNRSDFKKVNFEESILTSINFEFGSCLGCSFNRVRLGQAKLNNLTLTESSFEFADGPFVSFENAELTKAQFKGANFSNGNFQSATLKGADLRETTLLNADLRSADLSEASYDENTQWRLAKFNLSTRLPFTAEEALSFGMILAE